MPQPARAMNMLRNKIGNSAVSGIGTAKLPKGVS